MNAKHRYENYIKFMNIDDNNIKSTRLEEVDIPQNLELLNKWTIPKWIQD